MHRCIATVQRTDELKVEFEFPEVDEWPHKWEKDPITYSVTRGTDDLPGDSFERLAMNLAMTTWDVEIKPELKWVPKSQNPDITIEFRARKDDKLFTERPGVLAYAYMPGQGDYSGIIVFNDDYIWGMKHGSKPVTNPDGTISDVRIYNLIHTMIHEIGHSLGLRHSKNCEECVMHPYYNRKIYLHAWDIVRIRRIYGIRLFQNWLNYNRLKRWLAFRKIRFP